jgi:exoribonuclease II
MVEQPLPPGSLVLYKSRPARVRQVDKKKIEIEVEGSQVASVRPKDVTLLHPGPLPNLASLQGAPRGEVEAAWELLAGETTSLADLAELIYGRYTPVTAWATWQLVADGLYFSGLPEAVVAHSPEAVAAEKAARAARAEAEAAWLGFRERLETGQLAAGDGRYLDDVVALALGRHSSSRTLRALGIAETPTRAHALLLRSSYWDVTVNPYPERLGVPTSHPAHPLPALPDEPRRDLTHLVTYAIDDEGSLDPDDALSLEGNRLWVHVADVAALITPGSVADQEARARGANLYLPEGTVPMLPAPATNELALGLAGVSPALSFAIDLAGDDPAANLEIVPSWIRVQRLSYEEAEGRLDDPLLASLCELARRRLAYRLGQGAIEIDLPEVKVRLVDGRVTVKPLPPYRSRGLVREAMLLAGEAMARFGLAHEIPLPFATQAAPETVPVATTPSQMFALRRMLRPGQPRSAPAPHAGLGLAQYVQCTSPLRRYLDLVVHQQLRAFLQQQLLLTPQELMERVGAADAGAGAVRRAERLATQHWLLVYLLQNPGWQGQGVVVEKRGARHLILIPELALETQVYPRKDPPLDHSVQLALDTVNLPELEATFRLLE